MKNTLPTLWAFNIHNLSTWKYLDVRVTHRKGYLGGVLNPTFRFSHLSPPERRDSLPTDADYRSMILERKEEQKMMRKKNKQETRENYEQREQLLSGEGDGVQREGSV